MLTLRMVLWVLKERGLKITFAKEGEKTAIEGEAANVTPDLIADLKRFKQDIVHYFLDEGELPVPHECPAWREFLLRPWKPKMMVGMATPPFRKWVPYDSAVCPAEKDIQMVLMRTPKSRVQGGVSVPGGSFVVTAMGWRWLFEADWRPMPKGKVE